MNGEILRGEVYWICVDDSVGSEPQTGRPGVVVSADGFNVKENRVTIAFTSKEGFASPASPSINDPKGGRMRVLCDQLRTVDKSRLSKYMFTLDSSELSRVTGALASVFCLRIPKAEPKEEPKKESEDALRCEADMWRRMYEKVMDQLVEMRVAADMVRKSESVKTEVPAKNVKESALVEPDTGCEEPEEQPKPKKDTPVWDGVKVNINTVRSGLELKKRTGMSYKSASEIVRTRNVVGRYEKLEDLLALDFFGKNSMKRYGHMLTVVDEAPQESTEPDTSEENSKKTNINTANMYELMDVGFAKDVSARIVYSRKRHGEYNSIDDLQRVDGVSIGDIRKLSDKLEV